MDAELLESLQDIGLAAHISCHVYCTFSYGFFLVFEENVASIR